MNMHESNNSLYKQNGIRIKIGRQSILMKDSIRLEGAH